MVTTGSPATVKSQLLSEYEASARVDDGDLDRDYFLRMLAVIDQLDPELVDGWAGFVRDYINGRGELEEKARILALIGECVAAGRIDDLAEQMKLAMDRGAEPKEIYEIVLQSCIYVGMPKMRKPRIVFRKLMQEMGITEYQDPPFQYIGDTR